MNLSIRHRLPPEGQLVVPLSPRAISGKRPEQIVDDLTPFLVAFAAQHGGEPIGEPELLTSEEALRRTVDEQIVAQIREQPDRLWLVVRMRPARPRRRLITPPDQTIVVPSRFRRHRRPVR